MVRQDDIKELGYLSLEVSNMETRLEVLRNRAEGVGAIVFDGQPRAKSAGNKKEQAIVDYVQEVKRYEKRRLDYIKKLNEIELALAVLNATDRELIRLKYFDGLTYARIGERVGYSSDNVRKRIKKALKRISAE